ncbi:MAG TPA: ABC transporter substrate-binding protein [Acidimicrobiales bacterium]|nr:ABC transporter substrate-binding protein [Acidimicrobiales bacterium]
MAEHTGDPITRRRFIEWAGRAGVGAAAATVLSGSALTACARGDDDDGGGGGANDTVKVGVLAPFSGIGAFIGTITNNSLDAAVAQLNATGGIGGRKVELVKRDTGVDPTAGPKLYTELAAVQGLVGILWCGAPGLTQALPQIKRDGLPVIAVFNDLLSSGRLHPDGTDAGRSVFQMFLPELWAKEVLADYARNDRGYRSAALMHDTLLDAEGTNRATFEKAFGQAGLEIKAMERFTVVDAEYGAQLQRLKAARPDVVYIDGLAPNTAAIVKQLAALGASYVDTPTAKGTAWHPHIFGAPGGTGDKTWATLAGGDAKVGTVTGWHVGGLIYLPTFAIGEWMRKHTKKEPTGGEESPADGLAALLHGMRKAGSTDRAKVVNGMETMGKVTFASVPFGFDRDRHVSKTKDEVIVVTLERNGGPAPTTPPYQLGREWSPGRPFTTTEAGPTQLVRPTLAANRRAHPTVMEQVLAEGYGTQCTKQPDGSLTKECRIH